MKKVLCSLFALGVLVVGIFAGTTYSTTLSAEETNCCGHPIQPPI